MKYCSKRCRDEGETETLRIMSDTEIAWLAGMFDGEGHISVKVALSENALGPKIQVTNTCRAILDRIRNVTGVGHITARTRQNPRWKQTYDWRATNRNAVRILVAIRPWLIEKAERADAVIKNNSGLIQGAIHRERNAAAAAQVDDRKVSINTEVGA